MLRVLDAPTNIPGSPYSPGEEDVAMFGLGIPGQQGTRSPLHTYAGGAEDAELFGLGQDANAQNVMETATWMWIAGAVASVAVTGIIVWGIVKLVK
jgi:hypothetical protein